MKRTVFGTKRRTIIIFLAYHPPEKEQKPIGIWGQRHLRYIKEHKRVFYTSLLTSCKLNSYLADINEQAEDMFFSVGKTNGRVRGYYRTSQIGNINLSGLDG